MKNNNGYTLVDLLAIIIVFGAIAVFTISKVSYALSDDKEEVYKLETKLIETQAKAYGNTKIEEIKQKEQTVTVNHLINENFLQADDESGNIYDPREKGETLNEKKVRLSFNNNKNEIEAKLED